MSTGIIPQPVTDFDRAVQTLQGVLQGTRAKSPDANDQNLAQIVAAKKRVIDRYGPIFSPQNIDRLDRETFLGFLSFENNQHWTNLERLGDKLTVDMVRLRTALSLLVDEHLPLHNRLNSLRPPNGRNMVPWLGPAVITAILQVVYPDRYGVLNDTTRVGMDRLKLFPPDFSVASFAESYKCVNQILLKLAAALDIDLWTLDALWWRLTLRGSPRFGPTGESGAVNPGTRGARRSGQASAAETLFELLSGLAIPMAVAEARLLRFFRQEYIYYDGIADDEPGRILPIDVLASIAMNSRVDDAETGYDSAKRIRMVHRGLARRCDDLLPHIPVDADLLTFDPDLKVLGHLLHSAVQAEMVLTAVATKVLHRKRRGLIPMLDNVILDYYLDARNRPDLKRIKSQKPHAADVAMLVLKDFREDLQCRLDEVLHLKQIVMDDGFALTHVRILEVLIWTEVEPRGYYRR